MGFWVQFGIAVAGAALQYLFRKEREERIASQRDPSEITVTGESDYPLIFVIGERRLSPRSFFVETRQYLVTTAPFSVSKPGRGRYLDIGATVSQDRTDGISLVAIGQDQFTAVGTLAGQDPASGDLLWTTADDTPDGGIVIEGATRRSRRSTLDPVWRMVFYNLADGTQWSTLRTAALAARVQHLQNLDFGADARGFGVSGVHMRFDQPPFGDQPGVEVIAGNPFEILWDSGSLPSVEVVQRGKHIKKPTRGMAYADFPEVYTPNWAAAALWERHEFEGIPLRNIDLPSFIDATELSDTEIVVDARDDLCNARFAYLATADDTRPATLAGNAWPPPFPGQTTRAQAIAASGASEPRLWFAISWRIDGEWLDWGAWLRLGKSTSSGATLAAAALPITRSTLVAAGVSRVSLSLEPFGVAQAFGAPDPGDIEPVTDDDDDDDDGGPNLPTLPTGQPGGPLPVDIDPETYCDQFDADKTVRLYEINGLISSDDNLNSIRQEIDLAGSGAVVVDGGKLYAMPGADREPVGHIDCTDPDVEVIAYQGAPPLADRVNAGSIRLANSRAHHFRPYTTAQIVDAAQRAADGKLIHRDLGTRAFETSPVAAEIHLRQKLAELRPWKVVGIRLPLEYSKAVRDAVPGQRFTVNCPEFDLDPVILRDEANQLFAYGNSLGRYMRLLGRAFNFDDDQTMTVVVTEHPDGVYAPTATFPGLEPDPSAPDAFVDKPTGLEIGEEVYVAEDGTTRSRIVGTSDLAAVKRRIVQWRPVIPGGIAPDAYTEITVQDEDGNDVTLTATPAWGGRRQHSIDGSEFTIDDVRVGITYEVRLVDESFFGVSSEPSDVATITLTGIGVGAVTGLSLSKHGNRYTSLGVVRGVLATYDDDGSGLPVRLRWRIDPSAITGDTSWTTEAWGKRAIWPGVVGATYEVQAQRGYADSGVVGLWSASETIALTGDLDPPDDPTGLTVVAIQGGYEAMVDDPRVAPDDATPAQYDAALDAADVSYWTWYHQTEKADGTFDANPPDGSRVAVTRQPQFVYAGFDAARRVKVWVAAVDDEGGGNINRSNWISQIVDTLRKGTSIGKRCANCSLVASAASGTLTTRLDWELPDDDVPEQWRVQFAVRALSSSDELSWGTPIYMDGQITTASATSTPASLSSFVGTRAYARIQPVSGGNAGGAEYVEAEISSTAVLEMPVVTAAPGDGLVDLWWEAVDGASTYGVERSTSSLGPWMSIASAETGTSYRDSSLTNGTTQWYRVRAQNDDADGSWSPPVSATPTAGDVAPSTPTDVSLTADGQTELDGDWDDPFTWGTGSTDSRIYRYRLLLEGSIDSQGTTTASSRTFTGLTAGSLYTLEVRAETDDGDSEYASDTATTDTTDDLEWGSWSSFAAASTTDLPYGTGDISDAANEASGALKAWNTGPAVGLVPAMTGIWAGASRYGVFGVHGVNIGGSIVNVQVFQSVGTTANRMRRVDTDTYFQTNAAYLNLSGTSLDNYRSASFDFLACLRLAGITDEPSSAGKGGTRRAIGFLRWERDSAGSESGEQTLYVIHGPDVVSPNGAYYEASRRYE